MAKNKTAPARHRNGAVRDRSQVSHDRREILFPTEPSTIGRAKIDRAVERVIARKK